MLKKFLFLSLALMKMDLDRNVLPSHYDLFVNVEKDQFNGTVVMHLTAEKETNTFRFNSKNLQLSNLEIVQEEKIKPEFKEANEFVTVSFEKKIVGKFTLFVEFKGGYSESMEGFYKSKYNGVDLFSTHFEPADARQAFPCFDQPDMKATFSISIKVPSGFIALSNESLLESNAIDENNNVNTDNNLFVFKKTPKMSTYIVAYVVGKLDYIEATTSISKIPIRVYADPKEKHWGEFSLAVATRCLDFYEKYFEVKYPLSKLDMVAIPSFAMGAMENWGLVTYRKTSLLFDESSTPINSKKNIANTVCHELAHMWFGNLVTMSWWNDLWLNEGFATWAAALAIEKSIQDILPWDVWTSFINDDIEAGMKMDCRCSTHKIGVEVNDPVEVGQIFDAISYSKGSSVIKMLENWLGYDIFRKGLVHYFKNFSYSNTTTSNLWDSLSHAANEGKTELTDVAAVIGPWITREGFPYLTIKEDTPDKIVLSQKRFTVGFNLDKSEPWPIPIRILWIDPKKENYSKAYVMNGETFEINKETPVYKINTEVSGFYRTSYPIEFIKRLFTYAISAADRMNLYADSFALSRGLYSPLKDSLELVDYLADETNYEIFYTALGHLLYFRSVFYDSPSKVEYFNSKLQSILKGRFKQIDIKMVEKDVNDVSLQSFIASQSVNVGLPEAMEKFQQIAISDVHAEYFRPFFAARVDKEFSNTYNLYKTSTKPGEKQSALLALGATSNEKNLEFIFDNIKEIEPHDSIYIFSSLSSNIKMRNKAATLFINNFEKIKGHISNVGLVRHSIEYLLSPAYEKETKAKVEVFLDSIKNDREMDSAVKKCKDALKIGEDFRMKYMNEEF